MKYCIVIVSIFSITICSFGQPFGSASPDYRVSALKYENSTGEKATTRFLYDCRGLLIRGFWTIDNESRCSVNEYIHDERGNLISAFREFSDGITSIETFTFDMNGNKIEEFFSRSDGIKGSAIYCYENNLLVAADFKKFKGWLIGNTSYHYDMKQRKIRAELKRGDKVIGEIKYKYDSLDNLVTENWDFGGQWSQVFHYSYFKFSETKNYYSSPLFSPLTANRISGENYTYSGEIGGPSHYHYDDQGLLIRKVFIRTDGVSTTTSYQYDEDRKLLTSIRRYANGDSARFEYSYDDCDRLILRSCFKADTVAATELYFYNAWGVLEKAYYKNFDDWLTGTILFESDHHGGILNGKFKGEDGFDADLTFSYNSSELISGVKWEFTFGKYQQYWFEYE